MTDWANHINALRQRESENARMDDMERDFSPLFWAVYVVAVLVGVAIAYTSAKSQPTPADAAIAKYLALPDTDRRDMLIYLQASKQMPETSQRAIAEEWCAINRNTRRVCATSGRMK